MQRRWNVFPFLLTASMMTICKPWLEKSSEDSNKIYQLFERIPYKSYFRKYLKIWYQWFQGRSQIVGFHFNKFGCCKPTTFPKVLHHGYFLEFGEFFQNWHKEQFFFFSITVSFSRYYRGGVEGQELLWNCKRSEPLRKLYCRNFHDILS